MTADMNAATENLVEISGVEFSYGPRKLLKGLNLKIPRGKVVAILGARGSGKSTPVGLIGGPATPDRGGGKGEGQNGHQLGTRGVDRVGGRRGRVVRAGGP